MTRHLAVFLPSLDGGGAEKVMLLLTECFVARGVRCDLVIAMDKGQLMDRVPAGVHLVKLHRHKTLSAVFALARYLRSEHPDTLLSTIFPANITALIAAALSRYRGHVVIREANRTELDIRADTKVRTWLNRCAAGVLYRRADVAIAVAESVRQGLLVGHLIPDSRIRVIRNPVVLAMPPGVVHPHIRSVATVLACGRLEAQKDYATLLRAFARIRASCAAKLVVLGDGALRQELEAQSRELGIEKDVAFAGFVRDPQLHMMAATVFVHTALYEGFSNVLLEALACGCPIVATDCPGGVREVLADGKYGVLVPVGDDQALADAIVRVLKGQVHFPDASEYLRQFDIERVADAYLSVLFPPVKARV